MDRREIAEFKFLINFKHAYLFVITLVSLTAFAVIGWYTLKSEVAEANKTANIALQEIGSFKSEVSEIRCLIRQQNEYIMYKKIPQGTCR